jgi:hypothetical protein
MPYRHVYDVRLLDDLHNYFPAILYDADRFVSVGQLLAYVRSQARNQFDLFSRETREYMGAAAPIHANPRRVVMRTPAAAAPRHAHVVFEEPHIEGLAAQMLSGLLGQISGSGLSGLGLDQSLADLQPVIVRPTAEQIASATTTEVVAGGSEMCSICQDVMANGTSARVLRACNHRFHTGCIDTWFTRNVVCPVCRHDVRIP